MMNEVPLTVSFLNASFISLVMKNLALLTHIIMIKENCSEQKTIYNLKVKHLLYD